MLMPFLLLKRIPNTSSTFSPKSNSILQKAEKFGSRMPPPPFQMFSEVFRASVSELLIRQGMAINLKDEEAGFKRLQNYFLIHTDSS